jgi:hypothetical protein
MPRTRTSTGANRGNGENPQPQITQALSSLFPLLPPVKIQSPAEAEEIPQEQTEETEKILKCR